MKRILFLLLSVSAIALNCNAFDIKGTAIRLPENTPSEGALCQLSCDSIVLETATNNAGEFVFHCDSVLSNVQLRIDAENCEPYIKSLEKINQDTDFGVCMLEPVNTLQEVTVEAQAVSSVDGKFLFNPPKSSIEKSTYAIDLLGRLGIPGLTYNPLTKSVSTMKGNPVILIDGVPANQDDLRNLRATEVMNVEFSNFVPAMYSSMGSTLINVRLKKRNNGGSWNIQESNDFTGTAVDANTALRFHQGPSRWAFSYVFSYRNNTKTYDSASQEYDNPNLMLSTVSESHSPFIYRTNNGSLQYTYAPNSSLILMANYSISIYNSLRKSFSETADTYSGNYDSDSRTHSNNVTNNLNIYLAKSFDDNNSLDVNLVLSTGNQDYSSEMHYALHPAPETYANSLKSNRYALLGAFNYTHIFNNRSNLSACYFTTLSYNRNRYFVTDDVFRMKESNHHIYAEYQGSLTNNLWFQAKTGLKIDHITEGASTKTFYNNTTNINLQWTISPNWIAQYSGSFSSNTLSLSLLENNLVQTNPYLLNIGNPDLNPSKNLANALHLYFIRNNISVGIKGSHTYVFDPTFSAPMYDKTLKAYLSRPENGKYSSRFNAYLNFNMWDIFNMFQINGLLMFQNTKIENQSGWKNSHSSVGGMLSLSWKYRKWQIDYYRSFPIFSMDGYGLSLQGEKTDLLSVTFRPDKHWDMSLSWAYMFNNKGWTFRRETISPEYKSETYREIHNDCNWIRLTVAYNISFGSPLKSNDRRRKINLNDSQKTFKDYVD